MKAIRKKKKKEVKTKFSNKKINRQKVNVIWEYVLYHQN